MNTATIKTDSIASRFSHMRACDTHNARFSADWAEAQSDAVYEKSLTDCYRLTKYAISAKGTKQDHLILAGQVAELLLDFVNDDGKGNLSFTVYDDPELQSFVCYQLERYCIRIIAAHPGSWRESLPSGLTFGVGKLKQASAKPDAKPSRRASTGASDAPNTSRSSATKKPAPAANTKKSAPATKKSAPATKTKSSGNGDKLDQILGLCETISTRLSGLEQRVTALESR